MASPADRDHNTRRQALQRQRRQLVQQRGPTAPAVATARPKRFSATIREPDIQAEFASTLAHAGLTPQRALEAFIRAVVDDPGHLNDLVPYIPAERRGRTDRP